MRKLVLLLFLVVIGIIASRAFRDDEPSPKPPVSAAKKPPEAVAVKKPQAPHALSAPEPRVTHPTPRPAKAEPPPDPRQGGLPLPPMGAVPPEVASGRPMVVGQPFPPKGFPSFPARPPWIGKESRAHNIRKDRDIDDFVKSVRTPNIAPFVYGAQPIVPVTSGGSGGTTASAGTGGTAPAVETPPPGPKSPAEWEHWLGRFEGEVKFDEGKKVWQMALELSGKVEDQKFKGESKVELTEGSTLVLKASHAGDLTVLKKVSDDSQGLLLIPADGYYFQLYYIRERDLFAGNFYTKKDMTSFPPVATVKLARKGPAPPRPALH